MKESIAVKADWKVCTLADKDAHPVFKSPKNILIYFNSTFWLEKSQCVRTFAALVGPDNQKSLVLVRGRVFVAVRLAEITVLEDAI
jgi:hypothetical protein